MQENQRGRESQKKKERKKKRMRGIGGPLLTIGDLLSDVGEESGAAEDLHHHHDTTFPPTSSSSILDSNDAPQSLDLPKLFQVPFLFLCVNKTIGQIPN